MLSDRHYQRKEMRVLSREEQQRFIAYLLTDMDTCKFGVRLTLFTGMRIGELCALQWGNISLREKTIRITATLQRLRDSDMAGSTRTRITIGTPKSDTSVRTIPMTDYAAALCRAYIRRITVSTRRSGHTYVHILKIYATDGKRYTHRFSSRSDAKKVQQWFNADPPSSP